LILHPAYWLDNEKAWPALMGKGDAMKYQRIMLGLMGLIAICLAGCNSFTLATPSPGPILSPTQLKYLLIDKYGPLGIEKNTPGILYCDPDIWPIERNSQDELADKWFSSVDMTSETVRVIVQRTHMQITTTVSLAQKVILYGEYKKLDVIRLTQRGDGYDFQIVLTVPYDQASSLNNGMVLKGFMTTQGFSTEATRQPVQVRCPRCLALGTHIDTPDGRIPVQAIKPGMLVWTLDVTGGQIAVPVVKTSSALVPVGFQIVRIRLSDGRTLSASPNHPTADGRRLGQLKPGDVLDGAHVLSVDHAPYLESETFDLLPAGATGYYWADGILVGSTLSSSDPMTSKP
jgi:hypothetical protein